jgi:hypothetical protein
MDGPEVEVVRAILHEVHDMRVFEKRCFARYVLRVLRLLVQLRERPVGFLKVVAIPNEDDTDHHYDRHLVLALEAHDVPRFIVPGSYVEGDERVEERNLVGPGLLELGDRDQVEPGVETLGTRVVPLVRRDLTLEGDRTHVRM